jgi:membrane carboxypeptidase/penicillin-binding protein
MRRRDIVAIGGTRVCSVVNTARLCTREQTPRRGGLYRCSITMRVIRAWNSVRRHPVVVWIVTAIAAGAAVVVLMPAVLVARHVHGDRTNLPDPGLFERFEFLAIGHVYDTNGIPLIQFAREHRSIPPYEDIPAVVRETIVATEDKAADPAASAVGHVLTEVRSQGVANGLEDLLQGRLDVYSTVDVRVQQIVNDALEQGLAAYEKRHPRAAGVTQGSVVVLGNGDARILAESGGRARYGNQSAIYTDFNRAIDSGRQPGSAMKPIVYLAAFRSGKYDLESLVPDEPISVPDGINDLKWVSNDDRRFEGRTPARQALAESRNAAAMWVGDQVGIDSILRTARGLGITTALHRYPTTVAIPVMGKTGTTNEFRDALFVGSTYGVSGITVAVRIGFDDNRSLGGAETGARVALPIFRAVMARVYPDGLAGGIPAFPEELEARITEYLVGPVPPRLFAAIRRTPMPAEWEWLFSNGTVQR